MIGAGVLALPTVTAPAGFVPSSTALLGVWAFMCAQAFLISEVSVSTACSLGRPSGVSLLSLGRITLGSAGGFVTAAAYTFLHFAILTAYTAQGGTIAHEVWSLLTTHTSLGVESDESLMQVGFAAVLGTTLYALSDKAVEKTNDALVVGVLAAFGAVVLSLAPAFDLHTLLSTAHVDQVPAAVPVLLVSCVFHNIIPTVASRLECDIPRIRRAIVLGSSLPLGMFLVYNAVSLGADPATTPTLATLAVDSFSLLAIVTSFIGFVAGLVDLWSDVRISLLGQRPDEVQQSLVYNYLGTIVPPAVFCLLNKDLFLKALDVAGTYGIACLFGILPPLMAISLREREKGFPRALPGGNGVLAALSAAPCVLILYKLFELYNSTAVQ